MTGKGSTLDIFRIHGGNRLNGSVKVSGSKNGALPILFASLLCDGEVTLQNVPIALRDIGMSLRILQTLGVESEVAEDGSVSLQVTDSGNTRADYKQVSQMRASICSLGPLLARRGGAIVSLPGGCNIGDRPIDLHIHGMEALGAEVTIENGYAEQTGGGVLIDHADPTLDRNIIQNNHAGSCGGEGGGIAILNESYPYLFGNQIFNNDVTGMCDCICYFGGGIYVDSTSWPIVGGSLTLGNAFYNNYADFGMELFRQPSADTVNWVRLFAHHNQFEICPPDFPEDIFPENGWNLENCHTLEIGSDPPVIPERNLLHQNYPNPFNPKTRFKVSLHNDTEVVLKVFDIQGRTVEVIFNGQLNSGSHYFHWNAKNHSTGLYFIHLWSAENEQTRKAIFVK